MNGNFDLLDKYQKIEEKVNKIKTQNKIRRLQVETAKKDKKRVFSKKMCLISFFISSTSNIILLGVLMFFFNSSLMTAIFQSGLLSIIALPFGIFIGTLEKYSIEESDSDLLGLSFIPITHIVIIPSTLLLFFKYSFEDYKIKKIIDSKYEFLIEEQEDRIIELKKEQEILLNMFCSQEDILRIIKSNKKYSFIKKKVESKLTKEYADINIIDFHISNTKKETIQNY